MNATAPQDNQADAPLEVFRQAVEQSALAISITDAKARILYANPAFQRVTGYKRDEVLGHNESLLSYRVTPKIVYETMWSQLLRQRAWNGLLVNKRKDGSRYLADLTITPVVDEQGQTSHYLGMHRDVTEVHRLERQVQNQKTLIESVVDAAQVAIVVLDENERVVLDNQEYKKLIGDLGREPARTVLDALRGSGLDLDPVRRSFAPRELTFARQGGEARWFACGGTWIEELDSSADAFYEPRRRQYLLLTIQDITPLKEQQEAIRVNGLSALLAEQERIGSLREALAGAVFQLEGPFNMIAAAVRMLERRGESGTDSLVEGLVQALRAGNEALEALRRCIPASAAEAPQAVDINAVLRDVLRLATPRLLADGVVVEWQPAEELPPVRGRLTQLAALFKQVVDNALDAIHEVRGQRRELKVSSALFSDRIEVRVEDSGPGVPESLRLKAFQPFFTTKGANGRHIGMGLTVAQDVVNAHGGFIDIEAAGDGLGQTGCRVRVQFPLGE
ncbi:MAG: nitrogen fixation negative regulator NifL [Pseudomonadota bacterium]